METVLQVTHDFTARIIKMNNNNNNKAINYNINNNNNNKYYNNNNNVDRRSKMSKTFGFVQQQF